MGTPVSTIASGECLKDRYRLERLLGRGGMAAVWLGRDEVLERPVAIKVLSDTIASDPDFVARFRREARVAAGLAHPNLVKVFDFSEEGERPYLVMEFVPGGDLAAHVSNGERVDCERLAQELLDAVAHIHDAGIVHRDIKPQNILLAPDGTVKLVDFGIAQPHDATSLTQTGLVLGTRRYAAPEVMEGKPATPRSDLYSCGIVLRHCLGEGPSSMRSVVEWLTHPDPAARAASARQALSLLRRDGRLAGEPTEAFSPLEPTPVVASTPAATVAGSPRGGRTRVAAAAGAVAFVAAVAAFAVFASGGSEENRQGPAKARAADRPAQHRRAEADAAPVEAVPAAEGDDPARGSALNEEGYEMIQAGEYEAAVPVLEEAVRSFPAGTEELSYAYALFNLGNALRLSGHPEQAIPVLERRLEIPDQAATVQRELEAARSEAG